MRTAVQTRAAALLLGALVLACGWSRPGVPILGQVAVKIGSPPVLLLDQVQPFPAGNAARRERLLRLFAEAGCSDLDRDWRDAAEPHVVCTLPGSSEATIVVTANFDEPASRSAPDNWLGAAMLPSLYLSLGVEGRYHSYAFVGFADEGLGSAAATAPARMLRGIPEAERRGLVALVGLQGMHLDVPAVWESAADPDLHIDLYAVSRSLELPMRRVDFLARRHAPLGPRTLGVPALTPRVPIRPPSSEVPSIFIGLASRQVGEYLDSFRLVAAYLSYLDHTLEIRKHMRDGADPAHREAPASG